MTRPDLSNELIHWTKGDSYEDAYHGLLKIISDGQLLGGTGMIKGGYRCVCFTESPRDVFHRIEGKYKPFGIAIPKAHVFSLGGRPVIYQHDDEFSELPESMRWRHVRYDPTAETSVDFTWEREWRLHADTFELPSERVRIILPSEAWKSRLTDAYLDEEVSRCHYVNTMLDGWYESPNEFPFICEIVPPKGQIK